MTQPARNDLRAYIQRLPGGICFAHGPFSEGENCPKWPACITDPQQPQFLAMRVRPITAGDGSKPANCTCRYPEIIVRNMCGHDNTCPCYAEWAMKAFLVRAHHIIDGSCDACEKTFEHAQFPAPHRITTTGDDSGAKSTDCWLRKGGRVHCEVVAQSVTYVCDGCGWYQQQKIELRSEDMNITLADIRARLDFSDPNPHQEINALRKIVGEILTYLET